MEKVQFEKGQLFFGYIFCCYSSLEMNFFITSVSRSLFNFILTIISGGGFFESVVWFALGSFQIFSLIKQQSGLLRH